MLPGVRFLFAAVALAVSMLVFGLGAAALLRAAHEQFANEMSVRPAPISVAAWPSQSATPTLSMLRVEPTSELTKQDTPAVATSAPEPETPGAPLPEQNATVSPGSTPSAEAHSADTKQDTVMSDPKPSDKGTTEATSPASKPADPALTQAPAAPTAPMPTQQIAPTPPREVAGAPGNEPTQPDAIVQDVRPQSASVTLDAAPPALKPERNDAPAIQEQAKPATDGADAGLTASTEKPAAADPQRSVATAEQAPPEPVQTEPLAQVAALTGPIPTPRPDPRPSVKSAAQTSLPDSEAAKQQSAKPNGSETAVAGSPSAKTEPVAKTTPRATSRAQVKRKVKRRRQSEAPNAQPIVARPAAPMPPFGFPPS
ncbi:hypothetical protein [Rhodopseudomonas telluris]|uniref:Uncharacterized protein n=1 Tax=Rhodopseudomonas telluris TaxID=644215 RepID=A0ABV6EPF4_9BRAD